jgi:hypothetical protein
MAKLIMWTAVGRRADLPWAVLDRLIVTRSGLSPQQAEVACRAFLSSAQRQRATLCLSDLCFWLFGEGTTSQYGGQRQAAEKVRIRSSHDSIAFADLLLFDAHHRFYETGLNYDRRWARQLCDPFIGCGWPSIAYIRSEDNGVELMPNNGADRLIQRSCLANRYLAPLIQELSAYADLKNAERLQGPNHQVVQDRRMPRLGLRIHPAPLESIMRVNIHGHPSGRFPMN